MRENSMCARTGFGGSMIFSEVSYYKRWAVPARLLVPARSLLFDNYANGRPSSIHTKVRASGELKYNFFFNIRVGPRARQKYFLKNDCRSNKRVDDV